MKCIKFTIPGKPGTKQRPRFVRGRTYTPKQTANYENLVRVCFGDKFQSHTPLDCPVAVEIMAFFPIPKSMKKADKEKAKAEILEYTKTPDCDNICKTVLDGLNNIAWTDDKLVFDCGIKKYYSECPRVDVSIFWE